MKNSDGLVSAYGGRSSFRRDKDRLSRKLSKETFEELCEATDSKENRSFRVESKKILQARRDVSTKQKAKRISTSTVYNECQSSIRAKRTVPTPDALELSKLQLEKSINERRAQLHECNDRIRQHTVHVPAMRVLRNLMRKLYEADNFYMRMAFLQWKQFSDDLKRKENSIRLKALRIKNTAQELVIKCINVAAKEVEIAAKNQMLENAANVQPDIARWERTKSMYNMKTDFKPRGSLFRLPDVAKYKVKLHQNKKMLSPQSDTKRSQK